MFHWIKVFWHIWPDLMQLFRHVKAEIPSPDHKEVLRNALRQSRVAVTTNKRDSSEFGQIAEKHASADRNIKNLNTLEDE